MTSIATVRKPLIHAQQEETAKPEEKNYTLNAGDGLFLEVLPNYSKRWHFRYSHDGKRKLISMGYFPAISLQDAKISRDKANILIAQDKDPREIRQDEKAASQIASMNTFKVSALEWQERVFFWYLRY